MLATVTFDQPSFSTAATAPPNRRARCISETFAPPARAAGRNDGERTSPRTTRLPRRGERLADAISAHPTNKQKCAATPVWEQGRGAALARTRCAVTPGWGRDHDAWCSGSGQGEHSPAVSGR